MSTVYHRLQCATEHQHGDLPLIAMRPSDLIALKKLVDKAIDLSQTGGDDMDRAIEELCVIVHEVHLGFIP